MTKLIIIKVGFEPGSLAGYPGFFFIRLAFQCALPEPSPMFLWFPNAPVPVLPPWLGNCALISPRSYCTPCEQGQCPWFWCLVQCLVQTRGMNGWWVLIQGSSLNGCRSTLPFVFPIAQPNRRLAPANKMTSTSDSWSNPCWVYCGTSWAAAPPWEGGVRKVQRGKSTLMFSCFRNEASSAKGYCALLTWITSLRFRV